MSEGKVKFFNSEKGFGFISPNGGGTDLFFHISEVENQEILENNDKVFYEVGKSKKGTCAVKVARI